MDINLTFNKIISAFAICFLLVASNTTLKAQIPDAVEATTSHRSPLLPFDKAVRHGKLPNGFTYYIRRNREPADRVVFYLVNKAGSILENYDQQGLAHFVEHMNFNGTKHYPKNTLINFLQKSGVRFGADLNAYTDFDETVYQLPLPTNNPSLLKHGMQIMRDWAHEATFDLVELDKERGVILEEERTGKGPEERMQRQYWSALLNNSRYAERIPIGKDEVLINFKRKTICDLYYDWYRPNLQALVVVGDVDVDQIEKMIRLKFADLRNPVPERTRIKYGIPLNGDNKFLAVTDREMTSTVIQVIYKYPSVTLKTHQDYKNLILRELMNKILAERFNKLLQQPQNPLINVNAGAGRLLGNIDQFGISITPKPGEIKSGFQAAWRELRRVENQGFSITELRRAKVSYLNALESELKDKDKTSSDQYVNEYMQQFLSGEASPGIAYELALIKQILPGISPDQLNVFLSGCTKNINRDILILGPEKEKNTLPSKEQFCNWMDQVNMEKPLLLNEDTTTTPLLSFLPRSRKVIRVEQDSVLGIFTLIFENGIKVILKPTVFKNNQILFSSYSPGGSSLYPDKDFQSVANAAELFASSGAGNYDPLQLNNYLSVHQINMKPCIGESTQGINGATTPDDFEQALQLLYAYYTAPRKDPVVFNNLLDRLKSSLTNRYDNPANVFQDTLQNVLSGRSVRRRIPSLDELNKVNLDTAYIAYRRLFSALSGTVFTFVGNIDLKKMVPVIERYIGSLHSSGEHLKPRDLNIHIPEGRVEKVVYKGRDEKAMVYMVWSGTLAYSPEHSFQLDALKEVINLRLLERLREEESGIYTPTVSVTSLKIPHERFALTISFQCAVKNAESLAAAALDEVKRLSISGIEQVSIDKWRAATKRNLEVQIRTNEMWLSYLNGQLQNKEDLKQINSFNELTNHIQ